MHNPTIGIVGLGPVGTILASHLANNGLEVVVEDIAARLLAKIRKEGLKVSGTTELSAQPRKTASSLSELAEFKPDLIFVTTKACFLGDVLAELKPVYTSDMKIISFQNGLDNERLIAETLGIATAYRVVVNYAGNLAGPGDAKMTWFQPPNYVGAFQNGLYTTDATTLSIADMMTSCKLTTEETADVKKHTWKKTILNSTLCSLCALTGQTMREAMVFESSRNLAVEILREGLAVAKADGYDFGGNALNSFISYLEKGGAHKPSMLVDVERKRRTEVDFLSGAIVRYGTQYGIATPVNVTLTSLLKSLERTYHKK